jgi:hypothetical protein
MVVIPHTLSIKSKACTQFEASLITSMNNSDDRRHIELVERKVYQKLTHLTAKVVAPILGRDDGTNFPWV